MTKPKNQRVRVTIEADQEFVRLLNQALAAYGVVMAVAPSTKPSPIIVAAHAVLCSAVGASDEQIDATIPSEFREHFRVLHEERVVQREDGTWRRLLPDDKLSGDTSKN